jgi:hypothetical protein
MWLNSCTDLPDVVWSLWRRVVVSCVQHTCASFIPTRFSASKYSTKPLPSPVLITSGNRDEDSPWLACSDEPTSMTTVCTHEVLSQISDLSKTCPRTSLVPFCVDEFAMKESRKREGSCRCTREKG